MAETMKYVGSTAITKYDELIKQYIDTADAKSIKAVSLDGSTKIQFFTEIPTEDGDLTPAFTIELAETDISGKMDLVSGAVENNIAIFDASGQVIDGGKALSDFATAEQGAKADTAVQSVTAGETNGTINVDGTEVSVTGLGSAAYTESSAYDAAGAADAVKEAIDGEIGDMENLDTTAKSDLVSAINETFTAIGTGGTNAVVAITTDTTTEGYAKSYTISQGGTEIGVIDIPKDMVVTAGSVEVNPEGQEEGTYIVLTIANADSDTLYINVGSLVDIYTAAQSATQIQLAISEGNEISATIVAGGVGTDELADSAVTTAKIADGNVTTEKLSTTVQESLTKADSAVQSVVAGATNGTISVDGNEVAVTGLGSAAYTDSSAYDAAGAADDALTEAKSYTDEAIENIQFEEITEEEIEELFQ